MYKRQKYLKKILPFVDKDIIKVIIGQRRVGKSKILLQIKDFLLQEKQVTDKEIIFIDKENLDFDHIKTYQDLYRETKEFQYIFIDEIQHITLREKAVLSLHNEGKDVYITGSNSNLLSGELATNLRGRYIQFKIYPFDWFEFLQAYKGENTKENFQKYIKYGGMPYLLNLPFKDEIVYEYLQNIAQTIVLKDIVERFTIRNVSFFRQLTNYLATNIGNIFSATNITKYLKSQLIKVSTTTVLQYLEYMKKAFLIEEVKRFDIKGKKIFEVKQKYFFSDHGMRNAIIGGFKTLDIGQVLENIVYSNLVSNGYMVKTGEIGGEEIDFIAEKEGNKIYIQVAYLLASEETKHREFGSLLKVKDSYPKYVVTMDEITSGNIEGIQRVNIRKFLKKIATQTIVH